MFTSLTGYRTYICAFILVLFAGLHALGFVSDVVYQFAEMVFGAAGLAALRAAQARIAI